MGLITGANGNNFVSAEFIYSKIKREFKSFSTVNLLDEMDFPALTMEVLRLLGNGAMREADVVTVIQNGQAKLPKDYYSYHVAYRCSNFGITRTPNKLLQNKMIFENKITNEVLCRSNNCEIDCHADDKLINRIIVRQFVNEDLVTYQYGNVGMLNLTPNVRPNSDKNSHHLGIQCNKDITINDGFIFTNFQDDAIYMQYYAYAFDDEGLPMIPDNVETEKAVEWYIKYQILLNFWLVDDLANALNKWQKAETESNKWIAAARHLNKLPSFSTLVNYLRDARGISKVDFFSQIDRRNRQ